MLKLQFLDNRQASIWLVDERVSIGRDKSNKVIINDEGVSVFHAELRQENGKLFLWDSGSVNGSFVNGEKVTGKRELNVGDVLRFHLVEVQLIDPAKGPAAVLPTAVNRDIERPAQPLWQLKAMTGTISGKMFLLDGTKIIGRDPGCDIVVAGAHVSRRHAELSIRSGKLWMKDLGSSNGSFVNGKRTEEVQLKNGDEVKFDAMTFKVVGAADATDEGFDEADMTQFRPALAAKPATATTAAPAPRPAAPAPAATPAPRPAVASAPAPAPVSKPAPAKAPVRPQPQAQPAKATPLGPIVLIALVLLAVIAVVFIFK